MVRLYEFLQNELNNINPEIGVSSNQPYVDAINQISDQNEKLPENERVSVVSISWGFDRFAPGYEEHQEALARAKEQGVFIASTSLEKHYGFNTCGATRNPQANPNITPEEFWRIALETSDECRNNDDNAYVGRLINPQRLIAAIKQE